MDEREFMYNFMTAMRREQTPMVEKHYGFGLPKHWRIIDTVTGLTVIASEQKEQAVFIADRKAEITGH